MRTVCFVWGKKGVGTEKGGNIELLHQPQSLSMIVTQRKLLVFIKIQRLGGKAYFYLIKLVFMMHPVLELSVKLYTLEVNNIMITFYSTKILKLTTKEKNF